MQEAVRKEASGRVWHPIEGLPDDVHTWRNEFHVRAREEWREVEAALARRGTDRYARGALEAIREAGSGSPLKEREAVRKERR